jgi:hypothetical protein
MIKLFVVAMLLCAPAHALENSRNGSNYTGSNTLSGWTGTRTSTTTVTGFDGWYDMPKSNRTTKNGTTFSWGWTSIGSNCVGFSLTQPAWQGVVAYGAVWAGTWQITRDPRKASVQAAIAALAAIYTNLATQIGNQRWSTVTNSKGETSATGCPCSTGSGVTE